MMHSRIVTDNSTEMLQIVASLTDNSRGVIYNRNMFIVQATGEPNRENMEHNEARYRVGNIKGTDVTCKCSNRLKRLARDKPFSSWPNFSKK